jgi:hypothetical protein
LSSEVILFKPFPKQQEYINAVTSGKFKYMLYGGAVGGGKSYVTIATIIFLCKIFPGSRWAIVRKDLPTLKRNTIPTFNKIAPRPFCGQVNRTDWNVKCANGSEILFFPESITDDKELMRWSGLEVNGFDFEEANECQLRTFHKAIERAGRWNVPGLAVQPPILIMLTCNPSQSWVKDMFHDPWAAGRLEAPYFYLPARSPDNPYLKDEYRESLKVLPPHLYRQFVEGDWSISDDPLQIIPYQQLHDRRIDEKDLEALYARMIEDGATLEESLGIDVGELGNDASVFAHARGPVIYGIEKFYKKRTDEISALVQSRITDRQIAPYRIGVDAVGIGAGVWGNLQGAGFNVQRIIAGGKVVPMERDDPKKAYELAFENLKTQMWWKLRNDVITPESELRILNMPSLIQDLTSVRYQEANERKITCEPKKKTRERIGRSPDEGDAAVITNWVRTQHDTSAAIADRLKKLEQRDDTGDVTPTIYRDGKSKFVPRHKRLY